MDLNGLGNGSREAGRADVVILSGACCNPSLGGMDDQAKQIVESAAAEAGVEVRVTKKPMVSALYGGVPKEVITQMKSDNQAGGLRMPVVIINGKAVSWGAPDPERIAVALRELADAKPAVK